MMRTYVEIKQDLTFLKLILKLSVVGQGKQCYNYLELLSLEEKDYESYTISKKFIQKEYTMNIHPNTILHVKDC